VKLFSILPLLAVLVLSAAPAASVSAETRYISDNLTVYVRKGPSIKFGIKRGLRSGSKVSVLQVDKESGWSEVRVSDGDVGWMLTRELSSDPAARDQVSRALKAEAAAKEKLAEARESLSTYRSGNRNLETAKGNLSRENKELTRQLKELQRLTARTSEINQENQRLSEEAAQLTDENERLDRSNAQLRTSSETTWFVVGAAVLVFGMFMGFVIPKIPFGRRRNDSWSSL
jgi:SH3 domain protein